MKLAAKINMLKLPERIDLLTARGNTVTKLNEYHYRINGQINWWPTSDKWQILPDLTVKKDFEILLNHCHEAKVTS